MSTLSSLALLLLCSSVVTAATRETFNLNWRFDRFGLMPDGTTRAEPGAASWTIQLSASSQESGKGNTADQAMDGNPDTRWCASNGNGGEWLRLDLGHPQAVSRVQVEWEFPELTYESTAEGSVDGQQWKALPGEARHVRIRVTGLPDAKWASIREVRLFGPGDAPILNRRVESSASPAAVAYDDAAWRTLDVPHDWAIEGPFRYDLENNTGKLPWQGIGWYRKHFTLPAGEQGRRVSIDLDGAMANAEVWLNGERVGGWPYGYQGFRVDLTPFVKFGADNVLAVRLDTMKWGSRWYPGAGLYRNVWLVKSDPVHFAHWGIRVTTPQVTDAQGQVQVVAEVENQSAAAVTATVQTEILDPSGQIVAKSPPTALSIAIGQTSSVPSVSSVVHPLRWDLATPRLYTARTTVSVGGRAVDTQDTPFGFRTLAFTARDGFQLNGRRVQINGVCNHHDLGPLGAAMNTRALERQFEILREMGCNSVRTSHNPPAPELLELADRMGFLVMCEAFDCWSGGKTGNDYSRLYANWHARDLRAMVRHFANHPSVFLWSTGNEVSEQGSLNPAKELRDIIHAEDPTRPVTAGVWDGAGRSEFRFGVDVFGLNYGIGHYGGLLKHPGNEDKPFLASESSSCISSRGEYFFGTHRADFQISSYDLDHPGWACPPDDEFSALDHNPAFMGEYVWTGFDYLGEPTPYNSDMSNLLNIHDQDPVRLAALKKELEELGRIRVPSRSSYFGIVDLAGFPKDRFYIYQARWRPELPMAHLLPHWNWPERLGQVTPVHVYTSGDEAELFLNGKSLGRKKKAEFTYRLRWDDVIYEPGALKVVAYRKGREWATDTVKTTGPAAKLLAHADRAQIRADGLDLSFVTVTVADQAGALVPRSHQQLAFTLEGPGEIVAVCNGDAASFEPFQAAKIKAFNGLALVIVKGVPGKSGALKLRAASPGLQPAELNLTSKKE